MSDILSRQVEQLLFYVTRNAISRDNVEPRKVADVNRGCYLKSRPENYDIDLLAFDGSLGTTTSIFSSSIAIFCSTGLSSSSVRSGSVSQMTTSSPCYAMNSSNESFLSSSKTSETMDSNMTIDFNSRTLKLEAKRRKTQEYNEVDIW